MVLSGQNRIVGIMAKIEVSLTITEIARMVGKPVSTLYNWRKKSPELYEIVCRGCVEVKLDEVRKWQA